MKNLSRGLVVGLETLSAWGIVGASLLAQPAPDLVSPKVREQVVEQARKIVSSRNAAVSLPEPLQNPFVPRDSQPSVVPDAPIESPVETRADTLAFLARLAELIPATGTVSIGGEPLLLLGQKRLKVGDTLMLSLDGQSYEVSIASISTTSFTVKRGELLFSRPTRPSSLPTTTPSNRP
jgi:hypothetical protein